jgi:autotransporter-associated beta strand protein
MNRKLFDAFKNRGYCRNVKVIRVTRSFRLLLALACAAILSGPFGYAANIWDAGGGGNRSINNATNWQDDSLPDLSSGNSTLVFGTAGDRVTVNVPANVQSLEINRDADFRFITTGANTLTVGAGGIIALPGSDQTVLYRLPTTSLVFLSANQTWTVQNQGASLTSLEASGLSGDFNLTKNGSGTLWITGNSSRSSSSASVTLDGGLLRLDAGSALNTSASAPLFLNGGELRLATNTNTTFLGTNISVGGDASITTTRASGTTDHPLQTVGNISIGANTLTVRDADALSTTGNAVVQTGAVTLTGNAVFNVVNTSNADAVLKLGAVGQSGGARGFSKTGNGTLELTADSSYSGNTTVSGGLLLANAAATGTTVNVQSGGTLGGNGTVGGVRLQSGGTLSPGNSPGMLTVAGDATWEGGANYNWQVAALSQNASDQISKGINWDYFSVNGALNLSGLNTNKLNFNLWSLSSVNPDTNGLIAGWPGNGTNTWAIAGAGSGIRLNGTLLSAYTDYSSLFNINYAPTNGAGGLLPMGSSFQIITLANANTLYLFASSAAIPEPGQVAASVLLLTLAGSYWLWKRRRAASKNPPPLPGAAV